MNRDFSLRRTIKSALYAALAFAAAFGATVTLARAGEVQLKPAIVVDGADVRLGDVFDNAGESAMTMFGPAPSPGRELSYAASYVQAKAKQFGLVWKNPDGLQTVVIARVGLPGAAAKPSFAAASALAAPTKIDPKATPDLKRGDSVTIAYRAPGIQLVAMGKATADAVIGGRARAVNIRSNKAVDGVLTAAGRIEVLNMQSGGAEFAALDGAAQ